jgi:hypothetical protein
MLGVVLCVRADESNDPQREIRCNHCALSELRGARVVTRS